MTTTVGGIRVRILGDDGDLQKTLSNSTARVAKWGAAAAAAAKVATAALVKSGLDSADAQAKLARGLGATTEGLGALQRAAGRAGVTTSELETATLRLNQRLGEAMSQGGAAADSLAHLGLRAQDLSRMDVDQRMAAIADAMSGMGLSSQETAFHLRNLGIRQSSIVNLMQDGGEAIRESKRRIEQYGVALTEVDAAKVEAANDAFDEGAIIYRGFAQQVAVQLAPVLEGVSKILSDWVVEMGGVGHIAEKTFDFVIKGAGYAADAFRGWQVIIKGVEVAYRGLAVVAGTVVNEIVQAFDRAINGARETINGLIRAMNRIPGISMEELVTGQSEFSAGMEKNVQGLKDGFDEAVTEMHELMMRELPSGPMHRWVDEMKAASQEAAEAAVAARGDMAISALPSVEDEESKKAREALHKRLEDRLQAIREANMEEVELLNLRFKEENDAIDQAYEQRLITEGEWEELMRDQKARHEDALTEIERDAAKARERLAEQEARNKERILSGAMSALTTLMNTGSRKLFEIGKAAAISQSFISTYQGASEALKLGWPLGPAAAAAITTAGMANVARIRGTSFGSSGGGSAPTAAINEAQVGTQAAQQERRTRIDVAITGGNESMRQGISSLAEQINDAIAKGDRFGGINLV